MSFPGEQINAVAWDPNGQQLATVSDQLDDGIVVIRTIGWPALATREVFRGAELGSDSVAIGADGAVYWVEFTPDTAEIRALTPGSQRPSTFARLPFAVVGELRIVRDGLSIRRAAEGVDSVVLVRPESLEIQYSGPRQIDSFGASTDGRTLAVSEFTAPGDPGSVTIIVNRQSATYRIPDTGITRLTILGSRAGLMFVEVATGALVSSDVLFTRKRVIRPAATAGEVSSLNVLAWLPAPIVTLAGPVCFDAFKPDAP